METNVKQHTRKSKSGKTEIVKQHHRKVDKKNIEEDEVVKRKRKEFKEKRIVTNKGKVIKNPLTKEMIQERYKGNYPVTWDLMTKGKWKDEILKDGKKKRVVVLDNLTWKKLLKEHEPLLFKIVKRYNFGSVGNERFKDLDLIAKFGFIEGVNAYGKYFDKNDPPDFSRIVMSYVQGRIKENFANKLNAGLRVPQGLQLPYRQFLKVKENYMAKNKVPTDEELAKVLSKVWTKKTFYPQYKTAEERVYPHPLNDKVKISFDKLDSKLKSIEKKKDILPMNGFVSVTKDETAKNKEETHQSNLEKIEDKYKEKLEALNESFEMHQTMSEKDKKIGQSFIDKHKQNLKTLEDQKSVLNSEKIKIMRDVDNEQEEIKAKIISSKDKRTKDKYAKKLKEVQQDSYVNEKVKDVNLKLRDLESKILDAEKQLKIVEEFYKPLTKEEYDRRKQFLDTSKNNLLEDESKRYNSDKSSSMLLGVLDRIKQFQEIESIKEVPLNLQVDGEDEGSRQMYEVLINPDEMTHDKKMELLETHKLAKETLKQNIDSLMPVYKDIFSLYSGLHEKSPKTDDNLWGVLSTNEEIINYLDKKHKTIIDNPERFLKLLKKTEGEKKNFLVSSIPYIPQRYRNNPEKLVTNYNNWLSSEPKVATKKVKVDPKVFNKERTQWQKNKAKAKKEYDAFKAKNKHLSMAEKTKKYEQIKKRLKANESDIPLRFKDVKVGKRELQKLKDNWKETLPIVFSTSASQKNRFVNGVIEDSAEIMRRLTPIKVVRDLLAAHRKLVENGISLEKAIQGLL